MKEKITPTAFQYKNRAGDIRYLHQRINNKGTVCYYFSAKTEGNILEKLPEGYEVWEHPETSQVFLRKKLPRIITKIEEGYLYHAIGELSAVKHFRIDIQKDKIVIYTSESVKGFMDVFSSMSEFFPKTPKLDIDNLTNRFGRYQAMLRFTLVDNKKRHFFAERWCFRGSVDGWITIYSLGSAPLETLCEALFPHLGQESYYDLM